MNIENQEKIYLDANFLVYWALPMTPDIKKRVRFLLAKILNKKLVTSCLAMDEMWYGIKDAYNKIYNAKIGCSNEIIFPKIKKFTDMILKRIEILQFDNPLIGTNAALNNIQAFKLRPRDAFHLAIMKDNNVDIIATDDNDFIKNQDSMNITVRSIF